MTDPQTTPSRRDFLKTGGIVAAATAFSQTAAPLVHAGESNTVQVALVRCDGRGTGAAANALHTTSGPIKLVAMADVFDSKLKDSVDPEVPESRPRPDAPALQGSPGTLRPHQGGQIGDIIT